MYALPNAFMDMETPRRRIIAIMGDFDLDQFYTT